MKLYNNNKERKKEMEGKWIHTHLLINTLFTFCVFTLSKKTNSFFSLVCIHSCLRLFITVYQLSIGMSETSFYTLFLYYKIVTV